MNTVAESNITVEAEWKALGDHLDAFGVKGATAPFPSRFDYVFAAGLEISDALSYRTLEGRLARIALAQMRMTALTSSGSYDAPDALDTLNRMLALVREKRAS